MALKKKIIKGQQVLEDHVVVNEPALEDEKVVIEPVLEEDIVIDNDSPVNEDLSFEVEFEDEIETLTNILIYAEGAVGENKTPDMENASKETKAKIAALTVAGYYYRKIDLPGIEQIPGNILNTAAKMSEYLNTAGVTVNSVSRIVNFDITSKELSIDEMKIVLLVLGILLLEEHQLSADALGLGKVEKPKQNKFEELNDSELLLAFFNTTSSEEKAVIEAIQNKRKEINDNQAMEVAKTSSLGSSGSDWETSDYLLLGAGIIAVGVLAYVGYGHFFGDSFAEEDTIILE